MKKTGWKALALALVAGLALAPASPSAVKKPLSYEEIGRASCRERV